MTDYARMGAIASPVAQGYSGVMSIAMTGQAQYRRPVFVVNDRMTKARHEAEVSVERMAELLGCSRRTISRWETPGTKVPRAVLLAYHVACQVDMDWLEFGEAGVHPPGLEPGTHCFSHGVCIYCGERDDPTYLAPVVRLPLRTTSAATPPTSPNPSGGALHPLRSAAA